MTQEEIYKLAKELSDKEVAYLVASHMEHIKKAEFGFDVRANTGVFSGVIKFYPTTF